MAATAAERLATARLILRPPESHDAAAIEREAAGWRVARFLARLPHPYPAGGGAEFVAQAAQDIAAGRCLHWVLGDRAEGGFLGLIGLNDDGSDPFWELGYWLAPAAWGRGLATEAVAAVLALVLGQRRLPGARACVHVGNPASARVLVKTGFAYRGLCERDFPARGFRASVQVYRLAQEDWR